MKKIIFLLSAVVLMGCTYEGQTLREYIDDPRSIVKDPHFTEYQSNRDSLESEYLSGQITYAEYVEAVDELEMRYNKEVEERNEKATHQ